MTGIVNEGDNGVGQLGVLWDELLIFIPQHVLPEVPRAEGCPLLNLVNKLLYILMSG